MVLTSIAGAARSWADECAAKVALEGVSDAGVERRLSELLRREGGCSSPWVLRISAAPKGQFVVALWTGSDLETRWANGLGEAEAVAGILLRTAVEHRDAAAPPASAAPSGSAAPSSPVAPASEWAPRAGLFGGVAVAAASGVGPEVGLDVTVGTPRLAFGLAPRWSRAARDGGSRSSVVVPAIVRLGFLPSASTWLGVQLEVGVDLQRANGVAAGTTASLGATGVDLGAGARFAVQLGAGWDLALLASVRGSTAAASPVTSSTTVTQPAGNNGKGMGSGPVRTTTTSEIDPASADASSRLGGGSVSATLGVGRTF
jgi:hypothetical protein